ncbi:hypothetical protein GCM10023082_45320 [Streptomyces tremellae]|uniref:Uncharacterized protein n=1 Tax=Streptomyces tremellae TaxID=1124239 RepID=A0ABP7FQA4_9ACTN
MVGLVLTLSQGSSPHVAAGVLRAHRIGVEPTLAPVADRARISPVFPVHSQGAVSAGSPPPDEPFAAPLSTPNTSDPRGGRHLGNV